jgi:anti-sigma B factor antagonist
MTVAGPDAPGSTTVHLDGDIDVGNAAAIGDELVDVVARATGNVVVDCSGISFVESRGLAMMARVQRFADDSGCRLSWQALPLHVLHSIHVTGLDRYLRIEA